MYEDYEDDNNFEKAPESVNKAIEAWQKMMMRKLVEDNFENLSTKGFSAMQVQQWDEDELAVMIETFNYMINEFEEEEEYEKCAVLTKARQALIDRKPFAGVNI